MGRPRKTPQEKALSKKIGQRLRQLRKLVFKHQDDIAQEVGIDRASVAHWESGQSLFSLSRLPQVALAYGIPDVAEFVRLLFDKEDGEDEALWRVGTGMVVRVSGLYICERCGDVRFFQSATIAKRCHVCGETIWKRHCLR